MTNTMNHPISGNTLTVPRHLEISSRIQSALNGGGSDGASCNTFVVQDSVDGEGGIAESLAWAMRIHQREGAPTLDLSNLRANGTRAGKHGTATGPCSFARVYDSIALTMLRPTKKNGVCVLMLRADHPDIEEWLDLAGTLDRCYTAVLLMPDTSYSDELLTEIAVAYDQRRVSFVVKAWKTEDDTILYPNVCTEIRQEHKGFCTLSAIKVYQLANRPIDQWIRAGKEIGNWMATFLYDTSYQSAKTNPDLYNFTNQVGIGLVGLANLFGAVGVTYDNMARSFTLIENLEWTDAEDYVRQVIELRNEVGGEELTTWCNLICMYASIAKQMPGVDRIFTQQPTAHTALRLHHRIDGVDYSVAPEIAAPYAVRGGDGLSRAVNLSELRGNTELIYHESVQVRDEVPAEVYCQIAQCFQSIWLALGKAHTISYSPYDRVIDLAFMKRFTRSALGSLYYRLDPTPASTFNKTETWDDEGDLSDLLMEEPTVCSIESKGTCESCTM